MEDNATFRPKVVLESECDDTQLVKRIAVERIKEATMLFAIFVRLLS